MTTHASRKGHMTLPVETGQEDVVLDLFSGSGSFGIECLSRGVKKVFFFENYKPSLKVLEKNIKELKFDKD